MYTEHRNRNAPGTLYAKGNFAGELAKGRLAMIFKQVEFRRLIVLLKASFETRHDMTATLHGIIAKTLLPWKEGVATKL
jgi:hypothetical protein